ncbi:hypothetical protein [Bacillus sp. 1P06AnD]|uniref:hypothetical protein n=1 Tax=Bacillus sp. 1P06AnD TaxID=3132208 RepID=UPI00399FCCB2
MSLTGMQDKKLSPFTMSLKTELKWQTLTTREQPIQSALLNCSPRLEDFCLDLSAVGVIGSVQALKLYFNNDKSKLKKAHELKFIKRHEILRGNKLIPLYTLGATGLFLVGNPLEANYWKEYNAQEVLRCLVFFQFLSHMRQGNNKIDVLPSKQPFTAAIRMNEKLFDILIVRGNENQINQLFRYESEKLPKRMLVIVEEISHLMPVQEQMKPFLNRIRLTTDLELALPLNQMFYKFHENAWIKEYI